MLFDYENNMIPDRDAMRQHLRHLFSQDLDDAHDGRIEIAWTDAHTGKLQHARTLGTDQIEEAVELAVEKNSVEGQNVYVGAALRHPDTPPFGRCNDNDAYALTAYYADLDDTDAAQQVKARYGKCPPTLAVITGRHPHLRAQLYWRLKEPERKLDIARRQNLALARALGGDASVINPGRVMRLGGSIAWPIKPGRFVERTEVRLPKDTRPRLLMPGELARAFPPEEVSSTSADKPASKIGFHQHHNPTELLRAVAPGNWHNPMRDFVAHCVGISLPDWAIIEMSRQVLDDPNDPSDIVVLIDTARRKWGVADPGATTRQGTAPLPAPCPAPEIDAVSLPPRPWIYGRRFQRRKVTVTVAPPGVGKTALTIHEAVAIVTGHEWAYQLVHEPGPVWLFNNEDDIDELHRRMCAIMQRMGADHTVLTKRLFINSGPNDH